MVDEWLYATSLLGTGLVSVVFLISLGTYRKVLARFLRQAGPLFLLPALGFLSIASGVDLEDAVTLFLLAELLYLVFLFIGYVRGLLGLGPAGAAAGAAFFLPVEPYLNAILMIGSVYLSFTVAGSLLQRMVMDRKGSGVVLASLILLPVSVVAQVFYEFEGSLNFLRFALLAFLVSVALFELPLALSVPWGAAVNEPAVMSPR
ncbi:MAG: hypothetical protein M1126_01625 [Candidatus Thermoplasmatota archaeon]|nr:hypothetical protein [Candidatus Thermoplasmatota archaeon]